MSEAGRNKPLFGYLPLGRQFHAVNFPCYLVIVSKIKNKMERVKKRAIKAIKVKVGNFIVVKQVSRDIEGKFRAGLITVARFIGQ